MQLLRHCMPGFNSLRRLLFVFMFFYFYFYCFFLFFCVLSISSYETPRTNLVQSNMPEFMQMNGSAPVEQLPEHLRARSWLPPDDSSSDDEDDEDNGENTVVLAPDLAGSADGKLPEPGFVSFVHKSRPPEYHVDGVKLYVGPLMLVNVTQGDSTKRQWNIKASLNPVLRDNEDKENILMKWFEGLQKPHDPYVDETARAAYHGISSNAYEIIAVVTIENEHLRFYSPVKLDLCLRFPHEGQNNEVRFDAYNNLPFYCELNLPDPPGVYIIDGPVCLLPY